MSEAALKDNSKAGAETWGALINGEFRPALSGKTFPALNPGNGETIANLAECDEEDIEAAVRSALAAYPAWRKRTGASRAKLLMKLAQLVEANAGKLAELSPSVPGSPSATLKPLTPSPRSTRLNISRAWQPRSRAIPFLYRGLS